MSLIEDILESFEHTTFNYKGMTVTMLGLPKLKKYKRRSVQATISRLQQKNLIERDIKGWIITQAGKRYLKQKQNSLKQFRFSFSKDAPKNLLIMFGIPEPKKAEREWFRFQLKKASFVMIQKSVWVGPSPLPKEFQKYTQQIKLDKNIKTFKLAKAYI